MEPFGKTQGKFPRKSLKWYLLVALFLANLLIWHAVFTESRNGILTAAFLDVGTARLR